MKKALIFILLGVIVVMSLTFASYYVLTQFKPEREIQHMLGAMSAVETFSQNTGVTWTRFEGGKKVNTSLYSSGQVNLVDSRSFEHQTAFRLVKLFKEKSYNDLAGQIRTLDDRTYLTYEAPGPSVPGITFVDETWVSFERGELPSWGAIIPGLDPPITSVLSNASWTDEGIERLRLLLTVADVFQVSFDDFTELIHGVNTRMIDARFDSEAMRSFLLGVIRAKEGRQPTDSERLVVEEQAQQLEMLSLRLWIGTKDHRLYRFQALGGLAQEGVSVLLPFDIRVDLFDFDKAFVAKEPTSTKTFSQVLRSALRALPESENVAREEMTGTLVDDQSSRLPSVTFAGGDDPDQDGLSNLLETFYGTNPHIADTDGDGMNDGDEVRAARNPRGKGSLFSFGLGN